MVSIYIVPDGGWAHTSIGGEDPRDEEAVASGGSGGVLGRLFGGAGGDDGKGIGDGGRKVGGEERAADSEVNGDGLFGEG